jgi:hypothetical protein
MKMQGGFKKMMNKKTRGVCGGLIMLVILTFIGASSWAANKAVVENPLLRSIGSAKPAVADEVIVNVGLVRSRISNSTVLPGGDNEWTIVFGHEQHISLFRKPEGRKRRTAGSFLHRHLAGNGDHLD